MQETARDHHVVARDPIKLADSALGLPELFENDRRAMADSSAAITAPLDDDANHAFGGRAGVQLDRYVTATWKVTMEETLRGAAFLKACALPENSLFHFVLRRCRTRLRIPSLHPRLGDPSDPARSRTPPDRLQPAT